MGRWVGLFALFAWPIALGGCHWGFAGVLLLGSTAPRPYHAETLAKELGPQSVRTMGCLDVGFAVFDREGDEMLDLHVGNRCSYPEAIDLRKLVIYGASDKRSVALSDPRHEIRELSVGGSERGFERIRLNGAHSIDQLCFDLERIAPDAPEARPAEMCFVRKLGQWVPA